ncbi:MAG: glycosyltransferase family 1 protein [Campylobacterales bacterium]|nr:glycosyltransferase family 1 protein [Campylobacterales bacterium]
MPNKIYLDCTHTYNSGLNTGIQRVVKNIVKNIPQVSKELGVEVIPVVSISNQYYSFDAFPDINKKNNQLKSLLKFFYTKLRALIVFILPSKLNNILYHPNIGIFLNKLTDKILFSKRVDSDNLVFLKSDDILILLDTTWLNNNYKQLDTLNQKNVKIVAVIYDIIPITHPEFCTLDLILSLKDWYKKATKQIDGYIAISNSVNEDTYAYIKENINPNIEKQKFDYFYLGTNFSTEYDEKKVPNSFKEYFKNQNIYLSVSTIEPRKNHSYILDTFDILWSNNEDVTYIMIGRIGWNTESLIKRIKSHKEYNKRLFLLEDIDDNSLVYAYKNSKALIFASHVEGFGLPIIESLFYKLPVLASNTPIHREIANENASYFDLSDTHSLLSIIKNKNIKPVNDFIWQDWHQSTKELILKSKEIV